MADGGQEWGGGSIRVPMGWVKWRGVRRRERVWQECELRVLGGVLRGGVSVACVVSCGVFVGLCVWRVDLVVDSLKGV